VEVSDKVTLEVAWDARTNAVVGQARVTNSPSQVVKATPRLAKCPAPVSADKTSFTMKGNTWSWTHMPTIVK
jgi:hypothetical protein